MVRFLKRERVAAVTKSLEDQLDRAFLPRHIAIIMDGNGRWAQKKGLPRVVGHRAGMDSLREVVRTCGRLQVEVLTVYAFSTENWKRPVDEVNYLMRLLIEYLQREIAELSSNQVRVETIGSLKELPADALTALQEAKRQTHNNQGLILNIALNYGGRQEIVSAARRLAFEAQAGRLNPETIDEHVFSQALDTVGLPDPDLLIRPSGEMRISNFLLWQLAYTEFYITDTLWPDFREEHLLRALLSYQHRERRFGGLPRQGRRG